MYNLICADLFKLRKSIPIKIFFAITIISASAMVILAYMIQKGNINANMGGIAFMFSDANIISILGSVIAGILICGDFDNKIIHDAIAHGCSRSAVIISKAIVFFYALAFILLPYAIVTGIALGIGDKFSIGSPSLGFLHMLTSDGDTVFSASKVLNLLAVLLTLMLVYLAQLSVCIPLSLMLKKPIFVTAIYYGFSLLCGQLMKLKASSSLFDHVFACTPYGGNHAFITLNIGIGEFLKALSVSLIFIIAMLTIAYYAFRKSEIK